VRKERRDLAMSDLHGTAGVVRARPYGPATGRVRVRTLVLVRWIAIAGQAAALITVDWGFGYSLPFGTAMAAVAASASVNVWLGMRYRGATRFGDRQAAILLAYDLLQLTALLILSGALANPFAVLILAPVTVSATILSRRSTITLCGVAIACVTAMAFVRTDLPWPEPGLVLPDLYIFGIWTALVLASIFIAIYTSSVADEARQMSDALAATQMALSREQRRAAVGALAAAAAHELGSPLSTIAVVAREIASDLPKTGPLAEDANLLLAETARCRDILARLATRSEDEGATPFSVLPVSALVETAAVQHRREGIALDLLTSQSGDPGDAPSAEPMVVRAPEALYGLGSLIQNATQFARARVEVRTAWDNQKVEVTISDDGPGFSPVVLDRLGEPYLSTRDADDPRADLHMGLGVFIAATLLERTGASLEFRNRPRGGAQVLVTWPRERIEHEPNGVARGVVHA
jgi:two-component system, sensor histidine kinase RegB